MGDQTVFSATTARVNEALTVETARHRQRLTVLRLYRALSFCMGFLFVALSSIALGWNSVEHVSLWVYSGLAGIASRYFINTEYVADEWLREQKRFEDSVFQIVTSIPLGRSAFVSLWHEQGKPQELLPVYRRIIEPSIVPDIPQPHIH